MKSKTKFDPQVIQQFFIDHTEKFVVGLVAALFLYFVYQSVTLTVYQKYTKTPDELKKATDAASARIARDPDHKKPPTFLPYAEIIDGARRPIDPGVYPMPPILYWKPIAPRRLRGMPDVFAVEQLRAIPGRGAFSSKQGNADTVGQRWVAVTGLVPYRKQLDEYHSKFKGAAQETADDVPTYVGFLVQRAEVPPGSKGEPNWEKSMTLCPSPAIETKFANWNANGGEVADPRFIDDHLALRLPPLADAEWGEEVVCPPQIKLLPRNANAPEVGQPGETPTHAMHGGMGMVHGGHGERSRAGNPLGAMNQNKPKDAGGADAAAILGGGAPKPEEKKEKDEEPQSPEYLLLRYFDFDVASDKQYAYRVFLLLQNPNHNLDANVLDDAESSKPPVLGIDLSTAKKDEKGNFTWFDTNPRYAAWSQSCTSARGPGDMRLLAGPVVAAKGPQEIHGEVRVLLWSKVTGLNENTNKQDLIRGTVLNFDKATIKVPGGGKNTRPLATNCILVDLAGGEPLPTPKDKTFVSPGMILVLDASGNLVMHDQVAENEEWDKATKEPERGPTQGGDRPRVPSPPRHRDDGFTEGLDRKHGH